MADARELTLSAKSAISSSQAGLRICTLRRDVHVSLIAEITCTGEIPLPGGGLARPAFRSAVLRLQTATT